MEKVIKGEAINLPYIMMNQIKEITKGRYYYPRDPGKYPTKFTIYVKETLKIIW